MNYLETGNFVDSYMHVHATGVGQNHVFQMNELDTLNKML